MLFLDKKTQRSKDENGYLIIKNNPIAKAGVFDYLESEILEGGKDVIVKVYRDFEQLKAIKDTFANKPIVYTHQWVGEETNRVDGAIGSVISVDEDTQTLTADLIIYNPELVEAIEKGLALELSPAYTGDIAEKKGMFDSQSYSFTQAVDYCNHLAVVENGRAGKDLKIQDSKANTQKGEDMQKKQKSLSARVMDSLKKILDEEAKQEEKIEDEETEMQDSALDSISEIMANTEMSEEEKLNAIKELVSVKTEDEGEEEKTEDEETKAEETKAEDEEVEGEEVEAEKLAEVIGQIVETKLEKFADAQAKKLTRISDTYMKVSDHLGVKFNHAGMSEEDIYRFGYESVTGATLEKGMNAQTAFLVATAKSRKPAFKDSAVDKKDNKIDTLLNRF